MLTSLLLAFVFAAIGSVIIAIMSPFLIGYGMFRVLVGESGSKS